MNSDAAARISVVGKPLGGATEFDGIIIGAGHHGMILGSYLAKAGLEILLLERRLQFGGGLCTLESTEPGFYHNLHSINHFQIAEAPWFADLALGDRVSYITPNYEFAMPLMNGRALVFSRNLEETLANIARFSARDAQTFRDWNHKAETITRDIFMPERFSEPLPETEREALLSRSAIGREFLAVTKRQPFEVVNELFENEHVKLMFLFKVSLFGTWLVDTLNKTSPMGSVVRAFDLQTGYQLCRGGSVNLARALMESYLVNGGAYRNQVEPARIVLEGGRATGVELGDGTLYRARHFVASTIDVHHTFEKLIGRDQLPAQYLAKVDGHKYTAWSLFGLHLALSEAPRYTAAAWDPAIDYTLKYSIGAESIADLMDAHGDVGAGRVPRRINFGAGALSVLDPGQAPAGKHTAYAWHVMPYAPEGRPEVLREIAAEFSDKIIETWARYAPNVSAKNIAGRYAYTAYEYVRELPNMRGGDIFMGAFSADQVMHNHFGYRTPIPNLYIAGSPAHPGGAISGGSGYIAAGLIARDLGVKPWWQPIDARAALQRVPAN
jgi:phytoene dehydrogenase-like protein